MAPEQPIYEIPTSTGVIRPMQRVGVLEFALNGEPMRLSALAEAPVRSIDSLFIMFKDPTNEADTYAGGRYMDLPRTASGLYDLDFKPRLQPLLLLQRGVRLPLSAARELADGGGAGGRAPRAGLHRVRHRRDTAAPRGRGLRALTARGGGAALCGVVFDFDGVIADSEPLHLRAVQAALAGHGVDLARPTTTTATWDSTTPTFSAPCGAIGAGPSTRTRWPG